MGQEKYANSEYQSKLKKQLAEIGRDASSDDHRNDVGGTMIAEKDRNLEPNTSSINIADFKRQVAEIREKKLMEAKKEAEVMRKRATARKDKK